MLKTETLDLMLEDMAKQSDLHQPTSFWRKASAEITEQLRGDGIGRFRSQPACLKFFVPTYGSPGNGFRPEHVEALENLLLKELCGTPKQQQMLAHLLSGELHALSDFRTLIASDNPRVQPSLADCSESTVGAPAEQFVFEGRRFSRSLLNYMLAIAFLKKHVDTSKIRRVLEVGGGFGTLGEVLANDTVSRYTYIDIDIPPTAYAASYYLQQIYKDAFLGYAESRDRDKIRPDGSFAAAVLCPWQITKLEGRFDLFVNAISFQEMEPNIVRYYLEHVARLDVEYVLLRNLREGKQQLTTTNPFGVKEPILGDHYDMFLPTYDVIAVNTTPFGYRTVDGFHSEIRLYRRK